MGDSQRTVKDPYPRVWQGLRVFMGLLVAGVALAAAMGGGWNAWWAWGPAGFVGLWLLGPFFASHPNDQ